jgi:hypothetical protein
MEHEQGITSRRQVTTRIALVILAGVLGVVGGPCMGGDDGEQSRRTAALGDEDTGPTQTGTTGPTSPTTTQSGGSRVIEFRSNEVLSQLPLEKKEWIPGTKYLDPAFPPGKYLVSAKGGSRLPRGWSWLQHCHLPAEENTLVLDSTVWTTPAAPPHGEAVLLAAYERRSGDTPKIVCWSSFGGQMQSRVMTALKVDEFGV